MSCKFLTDRWQLQHLCAPMERREGKERSRREWKKHALLFPFMLTPQLFAAQVLMSWPVKTVDRALCSLSFNATNEIIFVLSHPRLYVTPKRQSAFPPALWCTVQEFVFSLSFSHERQTHTSYRHANIHTHDVTDTQNRAKDWKRGEERPQTPKQY